MIQVIVITMIIMYKKLAIAWHFHLHTSYEGGRVVFVGFSLVQDSYIRRSCLDCGHQGALKRMTCHSVPPGDRILNRPHCHTWQLGFPLLQGSHGNLQFFNFPFQVYKKPGKNIKHV